MLIQENIFRVGGGLEIDFIAFISKVSITTRKKLKGTFNLVGIIF